MTLHTKYRPETFEEVLGQDIAVGSLKENLASGQSQAFLLTGPAGTGKTTLARIMAKNSGCDTMGINEIDAASNTGIDAMKRVTESAMYRSLDGTGKKCYIIDECHMLSKSAWNSLLKILEEPPKHVIWVLCTTEPYKVPKTVVSRCVSIELDLVSVKLLRDLVSWVAEAEGLDVSDEIIALLCDAAQGSPRNALTGLAKCSSAKTYAEAESLLRYHEGSKEAIDLARLIFKNTFSLTTVQPILKQLKDTPPESIRITVFNYAASVWIGSKGGANWAAHVLSIFEQPCIEYNRIGEIALRCARLLHIKK